MDGWMDGWIDRFC